MNTEFPYFPYKILGEVNKPILLFLHGFMGDHREYLSLANSFLKNYCPILLDLPGHGLAKIDSSFNLELFQKNFEELIEFLNKKFNQPIFLVGYSMGGRIALLEFLRNPSHYAGLLIESSDPGIKDSHIKSLRKKSDHTLLSQIKNQDDFLNYLNLWYNQRIFSSLKSHPNFNQLIEHRLSQDPASLQLALRIFGPGNFDNLWPKIATIKKPMIYFYGENDQKYSKIAHEINKLNHSISIQPISNSTHNAHFENPSEFLKEMEQFLKGINLP